MSKDPLMTINPDYEHLELAMDSMQMRERFEKELKKIWNRSLSLEDFWVTRVFPRGKGGFAIQYSMLIKAHGNFPKNRFLLYGRLLGPSEAWPDYTRENDDNIIKLEELRLAVPLFPFDPELTQLPEFCRPEEVSELLSRLGDRLPYGGGDFVIKSYEVLGYRLERRCVLRYTLKKPDSRKNNLDEFRFIAKVLRPRRSAKEIEILNWLGSDRPYMGTEDKITIPHVYHSDVDSGVILMENAPGITLHSLIGKPVFDKACAAAGRLLRNFHSLDASELQSRTATDEIAGFAKRFDVAFKLYPRLSNSFELTLERLKKSQTHLAGQHADVCVHGDFYDKQVLYSAGRTTLLDCENVMRADAALDYGNFLAHLILRRLQTPEHAQNLDNGVKAFASGYGEIDPDFTVRACWRLAATLTRLAVLYSLRPRWRHLAPTLLKEAGRHLDQEKTIPGGINAINSF